MNREGSTGAIDGVRIDVGLAFHKTIDYDRNAMRRALTAGGAQVRQEARRLVSRKAISAPGENPGLLTGRLRRSIRISKRGSKGGWIRIEPSTFKPAHFFYPAILYYGSAKMNIAKRNNFMADALQNKRDAVRGQIRSALKNSLVPR